MMIVLIVILILTLLIWRVFDIIELERRRYYMFRMKKDTNYEEVRVQRKKDKA